METNRISDQELENVSGGQGMLPAASVTRRRCPFCKTVQSIEMIDDGKDTYHFHCTGCDKTFTLADTMGIK